MMRPASEAPSDFQARARPRCLQGCRAARRLARRCPPPPPTTTTHTHTHTSLHDQPTPPTSKQEYTLVAVVAVAAHLSQHALGERYGLPMLAQRYGQDPDALEQVGGVGWGWGWAVFFVVVWGGKGGGAAACPALRPRPQPRLSIP